MKVVKNIIKVSYLQGMITKKSKIKRGKSGRTRTPSDFGLGFRGAGANRHKTNIRI